MVLDHFDATGDLDDLNKYLPMAVAVVEAFRQRFPNKDAATGKIDMFPAQAQRHMHARTKVVWLSCLVPLKSPTRQDFGGI